MAEGTRTAQNGGAAPPAGSTPPLVAEAASARPWPLVARVDSRIWFWGAILGLLMLLGFGVMELLRPRASIALNVGSVDGMLTVSGIVVYRGHVVEVGTVHLAVSSADTKRHLGSATLSVTDGRFSLPKEEGAFDDVVGSDELRIDARFWGVVSEGGEDRVVETSDTAWSNCSTPITREDVSIALTLFTLLSGFVIVLFTMELTQFWARVLFATSYLATFLSVTLPLVAIAYVSQNPYLTQLMEDSPFGLVRAHTGSVDETQWLLNVGGTIEPDVKAVAPADSAPHPPQQSAAVIDIASTHALGLTLSADTEGAIDEARASADEPPLIVRGGLAIPFYVIILAIFGAGINMMRRIPAIQAKHVMQLKAGPMLKPIRGMAAMAREETQAACDIRQAVIEQHMYLLAAPFLAIAVYFLLQILANDIAQPVIVLMAFSAGLISERIVAAVIGVAGRTLGDTSDDDDNEDRPNNTHDSGAPAARAGR